MRQTKCKHKTNYIIINKHDVTYSDWINKTSIIKTI